MLHRRQVTQCETKSLPAGDFPDAYGAYAAALSQLLVLANSAIEHAVKTATKRRCGAPRRIRN
jgi:hypothetical protein